MTGWKCFEFKTPNVQKLLRFGFVPTDGGFGYATQILDGQFIFSMTVARDGELRTDVYDEATGEPYMLYQIPDAQGAFVGSVRAAVAEILQTIAQQCFETEIFKTDGAKNAISYVREIYGCEPEYLWEKFPANAVWRRRDNRKWFGAILTVSGRKLGLDTDEILEVLDLRMPPKKVREAIDGKKFFPAYHMNKQHWVTVLLSDAKEFGTVADMIDESYTLAKK